MPKTRDQLQVAVDEIREVCRKHGVVIIGTCQAEGIYGEITIGEASEKAIGWDNPADHCDNEVSKACFEDGCEECWKVGGIGDISV